MSTPSPRTATCVTALMLVAAAMAAPWIGSRAPMAGLVVRWFFASVCHQHAERSFYLFGAPLAVCARCFGIYAGAAFGTLLHWKPFTALRWCMSALALNVFDVAMEMAGIHGSLPWLRLGLGAALGVGAGALLAYSAKRDAPSSQRERLPALR